MLHYILIFILSLLVLIKSADLFVNSAEKIGLAFKISPFIVGVTIVALGTSLPELMTSIFAVFMGQPKIVIANVIGSNIANIFLVVGLSAIFAKVLTVQKSLVDLDAPLLISTTALFIFIMIDGVVVAWEGILLLSAFITYLLYIIYSRKKETDKPQTKEDEKISPKVVALLLLGGVGLPIGSYFTINSVVEIASALNIAPSLVAIIAVAIGTSLPELIVSVRAAMANKCEIALGNVFGSNVFNILLVAGIPSLIRPLPTDNLTFSLGLPFLAVATLLFVVSSISKKIHIWEGMIYFLIYILFVIKLIGF